MEITLLHQSHSMARFFCCYCQRLPRITNLLFFLNMTMYQKHLEKAVRNFFNLKFKIEYALELPNTADNDVVHVHYHADPKMHIYLFSEDRIAFFLMDIFYIQEIWWCWGKTCISESREPSFLTQWSLGGSATFQE